jgi:hypothetical protein
VGWPGGRV